MGPDAHFLDTLLPALPTSLAAQIRELRAASPTNQSTLENLIRFILGVDPSTDTQMTDWAEKQAELKSVLASLVPNFASQVGLGDRKRSREDEHPSTSGSAAGTNGDAQPDSKKPRLGLADGGSPTPIDPGAPLFTLHALSVTSPIRKKVDITVHENAVVMTHPTSKVVEATIPTSFLRRAFVLPTRGKTKPHWTVVLLSADVPDAKGKGAAPAPAAGASENQQIIFGVDATTTTAFTTTTYSSQLTPTSHPKGTSTLPLILQLLSHLPSHPTLNPPIQPASQGIFKSACPGIMGAATSASSSELGIPGVEAYRAAKAGNLWFCKEGVLWGESKPCEFWAVGEMDGREGGVRIQGAGRTCSVILIRRPVKDGQEKDAMQVDGQEGEAEEDEVEPGEETEFGMVDSKEREGIQEWVRQHRRLFWLPSSSPSTSAAKVDKGKQKATPNFPLPQNTGPLTIHTLQDLSDDEDADFDEDVSDLDGSEHSSQEGSSSSEGEEDEEEEEAAGAGSEADANADSDAQDEEDEEDDLDPAHHPLLRPGAMPRMSKAAMQMAVGIVEGAFLGSSAGGAGEEEDEDGDGEDEEDELDE
ncbi:hypothetical protein CVT26_000280 [Gymnopilus dilepis]|uniref:Histone chaperone RTT106/FACT complex subunit SPT16-like middle domain-containing protein n=1 Tax=Gymnopilus dilepis TaxID=231916 RepID=A0A409WBJ0_9AGAR|nr:hypothetical protein CVT26_000280 [Gymnopilus dilepis]